MFVQHPYFALPIAPRTVCLVTDPAVVDESENRYRRRTSFDTRASPTGNLETYPSREPIPGRGGRRRTPTDPRVRIVCNASRADILLVRLSVCVAVTNAFLQTMSSAA
jgi:hypothetical protein